MVKRYNVKSEIDLSAWIEEQPGGVLVMASDYDALAADLAKYQECRVHDVDEKAWLSKRVTELEAALRESKRVLEVYAELPKDRWPGPPTSALEAIESALNRSSVK